MPPVCDAIEAGDFGGNPAFFPDIAVHCGEFAAVWDNSRRSGLNAVILVP
jgi:hypothetical protein